MNTLLISESETKRLLEHPSGKKFLHPLHAHLLTKEKNMLLNLKNSDAITSIIYSTILHLNTSLSFMADYSVCRTAERVQRIDSGLDDQSFSSWKGQQFFFFPHTCRRAISLTQPLTQWPPGVFLEEWMVGTWNQTLTAKYENEQSYTFTPLYAFMACAWMTIFI